MGGNKAPEPQAQTKRSSRLAAREEASVDTRKRGRSSTGDEAAGKRGAAAAAPAQPPSKRGKTEAPAADRDKAKGSPVSTRSQPAAAAAASSPSGMAPPPASARAGPALRAASPHAPHPRCGWCG